MGVIYVKEKEQEIQQGNKNTSGTSIFRRKRKSI